MKIKPLLSKYKQKIFDFSAAFTSLMAASIVPVFADGGSAALTSAQNLLSKAATAGGGLWAVWGLVQLGMSIKDHDGPGMGKAIWQILGGAIIIAAGTLISSLSLSM